MAKHLPPIERLPRRACVPTHLDLPGTELVFIGGGDRTLAELGPLLEASAEDATAAALRDRVRRASGRPPSAPLLEGLWH